MADGFRIEGLWIAVTVDDDGEEGTISVPGRDGSGRPVLMPLFAADEVRLREVRELGLRWGRQHRRQVRLVRMTKASDEVLYPPPAKEHRPEPEPEIPAATGEDAEALRCPCGQVLDGLSIPGIGDKLSMVRLREIMRDMRDSVPKQAMVIIACVHCLSLLNLNLATLEFVPVTPAELAELPAAQRAEVESLTAVLAAAKRRREAES